MNWTDDPQEREALDALRALLATLAADLYSVAEARDIEPAGGHVITT
ncbi:hypothetical protein AB0I54_41925 [Streptomyces sp. NPDC050625]